MAKKKLEVDMVEVTLRVPLIYSDKPSVRGAYVQKLSHAESRTLRALFDGLAYEGATVQTSLQRPVQHVAADPLRWLLQQISQAAG